MHSTVERKKLFPGIHFGTLWHNSDFLKLWSGETVSLLGSQVTTLALPLTAVTLLKASSLQLGFLYAAGLAPFLFLTLLAGVWIDHHRRRPILIIANVGRALLLSLIPLLAFTGQLHIEELYLIALFVGCFTVFFYLAYQAFLPTLIQRESLVEGNSKLSASESIADIGGRGLAGFLVQLVTAPFAIVVDALSFCLAAISLMLIRIPETLPQSQGRTHNPLQEIGEGLRITLSNRYLCAFVGEAATYNLFNQVILTVFVLYAVNNLHLSAAILGLLFASGSIGALLAALLTAFVAHRVGVGLTIIATAALSDVPLLVLPFVKGSTPGELFILLAAFFLQGIGIAGCNVHVDSIRQAIIPNHLRGRVNSSYRLLASGALALGSLLGGWLGVQIGLQATLLVGAVGLLTSWLWVVFSPVRKIRTFP